MIGLLFNFKALGVQWELHGWKYPRVQIRVCVVRGSERPARRQSYNLLHSDQRRRCKWESDEGATRALIRESWQAERGGLELVKEGEKPLKRERTWPLRLISNLGKHSKRTESTQCGRDTRSWWPGATGWFHFVINERLRQNFLYCTVRNIKIWEIWIIYILGLSLHLLDPLKRPHLCAEKL